MILLSHSNATAFILAHNTSTNALSVTGKNSSGGDIGDIRELDTKTVDVLNIMGCNAGYYDIENNIARTMLRNNDIETVIAWDGNVGFGPGGKISELLNSYDARLSRKQSGFHHYNEVENIDRDPMGQLIYRRAN